MDYYHANMEDTIAFGDSMNDYQMLEKANQGIVFEGAKEKLLDIAYDTFKDPGSRWNCFKLRKIRLNIERIGTYGKCTTCKNTWIL